MMKKGEKRAPKVRFKGFVDDWEQRKLKDLAVFSKGNGYTKNDLTNSGTPIILYGRLYTNYETVIKKVDTFAIENGKSILSEGNEVIVPASGESAEDISRASVIAKAGVLIGGDLNIIKPNRDIDSVFLALTISNGNQQKELSKRAQGKSVVHLHNSDLKEIDVFYPRKKEQVKIRNLIRQIEIAYALLQRKLDKLQKLKQGFLQQMFPQNGENVPRLRFANFRDEWEQRKLGDVVKRVTRKNENLESKLPLTISAQHGLVDQNTFFNKQVASRDTSNYYLLKNGEFAYNKSHSNDYPWGAVKRLDKYEQGVLSTLYIVFRPTQVNSNFLVSYYDTNGWHKEVSMRAAEGARNHGLLNIPAEDFFDTELKIPTEEAEQEQIGRFFNQLDNTIALLQTKLGKLQSLKKTYLQKMFI